MYICIMYNIYAMAVYIYAISMPYFAIVVLLSFIDVYMCVIWFIFNHPNLTKLTANSKKQLPFVGKHVVMQRLWLKSCVCNIYIYVYACELIAKSVQLRHAACSSNSCTCQKSNWQTISKVMFFFLPRLWYLFETPLRQILHDRAFKRNCG